MQLHNKILIGLGAGVLAGAAANAAGVSDAAWWGERVLPLLEFVGAVFVRLITMIVVPLVVASLLTVTLILVLQSVGLAGQAAAGIALILGVDRLLDMLRTAVNVTGDLSCAAFVARSEGELLVPHPVDHPVELGPPAPPVGAA